MNSITLQKYQRIFLFLLIVTLPLMTIPDRFSISFLGRNLSNYFLYIGIIFFLLEYWKCGFEISSKVKFFICCYLGWQMICLAIGLVTYQYDALLSVAQSSKLQQVVCYLGEQGIILDEMLVMKSWLFLRFTKDILVNTSTVFIVTYWVYHLYQSNFSQGFKDIRRACVFLTVIMGLYSAIELYWFKTVSGPAARILDEINPYLYDVASVHGWWPPLEWWGQLRSICPEPSFFGILSIFILPILWSLLFEKGYILAKLFLVFYFTFMIAATFSRTAVIITSFQTIWFALTVYWNRTIDYLARIVIVFVLSVGAYLFNLVDFTWVNAPQPVQSVVTETVEAPVELEHSEQPQEIVADAVTDVQVSEAEVEILDERQRYLENTVLSIKDPAARSNMARLGNTVSHLFVALKHPVFGVGTGLQAAYVDENIPDFARENGEIQLWGTMMRSEGVLKSGYPILNNYLGIAAQNGLLGLGLYLMPVLWLLSLIWQERKNILRESRAVFLIISMLGLLMTQLCTNSLVNCNGIVWGLLFCKLHERRNMC